MINGLGSFQSLNQESDASGRWSRLVHHRPSLMSNALPTKGVSDASPSMERRVVPVVHHRLKS